MPAANDEPSNNSNNPFIRFRHHVDTSIHAGLNTLRRSPQSSSSTPNSTTTPYHPTTQTQQTPFSTPPDNIPTATTTATNMPPPPPNTSPELPSSSPPSPRSATAEEARQAWHHFLTHSPYSPLLLEREARGGKPTPQDLLLLPSSSSTPFHHPAMMMVAEEVEAGWWLEAFEDLMRVSSGLGLADLSRPHYHRYGFGGGWVREMAWLERMERRGLGEVLFPVCEEDVDNARSGGGYVSPRTMGEWVERRRVEGEREREEVGRVWEELIGGRRAVEEEVEKKGAAAADAWVGEVEREVKREMDRWRDVGQDKATSFFDGIGGVVRALGKVLEEEAGSLQRFGRGKKEDDAAAAVEKKDLPAPAPETESDLYSAIQSAFHESERSLSSFFKSVSEGWRHDTLPEPKPVSPPKTETTEVVQDGITKKTTKKEFVDEHGNTHSKTETTWTDGDGRVVMRQVHSAMGRSEHWEKTAQTESTKHDTETANEAREQKEGGWFWK
ncbi:hypothetical protein C8A00DRAFT_15048 [Chaetomidium leptoderma]|uniref:Uncharacterized protein n=1 Tax=Chaetomidium leptoderma TaxID=669021 RepID=A0AAN6ZWR5_9PEZI|nr:hypothetical protein C8A00DRAFT_15048 [Chaetomidium leptoderma]